MGHRVPAHRLAPLTFVAAGREVLVVGQPLPPLPGLHLWVDAGVAVPVGWKVSPAVGGGVLRAVLKLEAGEMALIRPAEGPLTWERLPHGAFVRASRSAARATFGVPGEAVHA